MEGVVGHLYCRGVSTQLKLDKDETYQDHLHLPVS